MTPTRTRTSRDVLLIIALFALLVVLVNPVHEFPIGDDWEYAHTVQRLLATGQFYRSPVVQATILFPAAWGGLFAGVLGFSFTALRLSTLPLAAGTLLAFYGILAELGLPPARRLLGALTLMVAPLFVFYTFTFMTEVPFLFWLLLGLWCSLRGLGRGKLAWRVAGSACGALAYLTRQLGLALPIAVALVVVTFRPRAEWPRLLAANLLLPLAAVVGFYAWQRLAGQSTWADQAITEGGTLNFLLSPQLPLAAARRVVLMSVTLALYMAPLWLAFLPGWRDVWRAARVLSPRLLVAGLALGVFFLASVIYFGSRGEWWPYYQESLTQAGLGPSLALFAYPNDRRPPFLPMPFWMGMTLVGAGLATALALNLLVRFVRLVPHPALRHLPISFLVTWRALGPRWAMFYLTFLVVFAAVLVFPIIYGRYFLPLLPAAIILLLDAGQRLRSSTGLASASLLALGLLSVGLMWDSWNWHAARWSGSQRLVDSGVPLTKLDSGYEWNGWWLAEATYAYLPAPNQPIVDEPWRHVIDPQYMVTFSVVPGYHIADTWPFYSPFRPGGYDQVLLLERGPAP